MKIKQRIAALVAATVMAVSMMSIGTNAYSSTQNWGVRYSPTTPTSVNVYSFDNILSSESTIYSFQENCTSKNNEPNYHGNVSYVTYAGYLLYNDGSRRLISDYFNRFYVDYTYTTVSLKEPVKNTYKLVVNHHLYHNGLYTTFNGSVRA